MDRGVKVDDDLILGYGSKSSKAGVSCISEPGSSVYSFTGRTHIPKSFLKNATGHLFFCSVTSSHKVEFHLQTSCLPSLNSLMSLFSSNDLLCQRYVSIPPFVNTPLQRRWEREKGRRRWKKTSQFAATSVDTGPTSTNWIQCYDL